MTWVLVAVAVALWVACSVGAAVVIAGSIRRADHQRAQHRWLRERVHVAPWVHASVDAGGSDPPTPFADDAAPAPRPRVVRDGVPPAERTPSRRGGRRR